MAEAIATGALTLDALRNGAAATRALPPGAISPAPVDEPQTAAAERPEEAADLLDDFLLALLDLPGDAWPDLAATLPDEVFDRIDHWMEDRFAS